MLPDDDKRFAIETCRSSESVLKKLFKNKWHTISAFVGCVIIIALNLLVVECIVSKFCRNVFEDGVRKTGYSISDANWLF